MKTKEPKDAAPELTPLDNFVKKHGGNMAEAARALDVDYMQLYRWFIRKAYADRNSRKLAALRGVSLPDRP